MGLRVPLPRSIASGPSPPSKSHFYHYKIKHSALKRKKTLRFVTTWMNLEDVMLSEINQIQKDQYYMILLIYGI